ncbi:phenylacetate--CoA ligase family protein [Brevibacillus ginsengisoli]|uniref:phenylacetate--CoA ligase family protein n=1 Tax=Brevibacillus ginsengisoli TaxID=363854 RepID=UPI003CEA1CEA
MENVINEYWDKEKETMPVHKRNEMILAHIKQQLDYVYHQMPFYREFYDQHHFHPSMVNTLEDFTEKVPILTKDILREEQRQHHPYGRYLGFDPEDGAHIHGSSGTTGRPTFYLFSKEDIAYIGEVMAQALFTAGVRRTDVVQISTDLGMFMGGWGSLWGVERIGATAFTPGAGNAERHIRLMYEVGSSVLITTPTFALRLMDEAQRLGYDTSNSPLRIGIFIGEPGAGIPGIKKSLEEGWGIDVMDCATTSEMTPWATNVECAQKNGMHVLQDEVYTEIVDKENPYRAVPEGTSGGVIYTHLKRKGQPMIRFWSGDESHITTEACACGRTYPRLPNGVYGRLDDMLIIRGVNVYPSAVQRSLLEIEGLGNEHRIVLERVSHMDEATVKVEYHPDWIRSIPSHEREIAMARLHTEVHQHLRAQTGIRFNLELLEPQTLERFDVKARRVIDRRLL